LEAALRANGKSVEHHEIQANYGHDSFLLEERRQAPVIAEFLERVANAQ
jgi:homoserine O-acetyltransferase